MDEPDRDLAAVLRDVDNLDGQAWPEVERLAASGAHRLVPRLRTALDGYLADRNFYGRDLIARILGGIQGPAAFPVLLGASAVDLGDDQDSLCADILDLVDTDPAACRATMLRFAADPDPALRRAGLWALGHAAEPADLALLAAAASTDPDPGVRSTALGAIGSIKDRQVVYDVLVRALADAAADVRIAAVSGLGWYGWPSAVPVLAGLVADPAARVRWHLVFALGRLAVPAGLPALQVLAHDDDATVRCDAAEAMRGIGREGPLGT